MNQEQTKRALKLASEREKNNITIKSLEDAIERVKDFGDDNPPGENIHIAKLFRGTRAYVQVLKDENKKITAEIGE